MLLEAKKLVTLGVVTISRHKGAPRLFLDSSYRDVFKFVKIYQVALFCTFQYVSFISIKKTKMKFSQNHLKLACWSYKIQ